MGSPFKYNENSSSTSDAVSEARENIHFNIASRLQIFALLLLSSCVHDSCFSGPPMPSARMDGDVTPDVTVSEKRSRIFDIVQSRLTLKPNPDQPVNIIEAYPDDKKLAIIINGDSEEERHTKNVERAIDVLGEKGFSEFYVASTQSLEKLDIDAKIEQFPGSGKGVNEMFDRLAKGETIQKDDLVFFYATGHGRRKEKDEACLSLSDYCYAQDVLIEKLQLIKERGAQGVFVIDTCFSGSIPSAIADSGVEGISLSPAADESIVGCTAFTPILFENIRTNRDLNGDGFSEPVEWFRTAIANYQTQVPMANEGTFIEPRPELSKELLKRYRKTGQTLIVEIGATWCAPCKEFDPVLHEVNSMIGEQVEMLQLTTDTNPESAALLKELGIKSKVYPATVVIQPSGEQTVIMGSQPAENLLLELDGAGVSINKDLYREVLTSEDNPPHPILVLKHAPKYAGEPWAEPIIRKAAEENPMAVLKHLRIDPAFPWFEDLIKAALETDLVKKNKKDVCGWGNSCILKFSHVYAHTPWGKKKILDAIKRVHRIDRLNHLEGYVNQPWAEEVVRKIFKRDRFGVMLNAEHFASQSWAEDIIGPEFVRRTNDHADEMEHFAHLPWAEKYIREAALKKPQYVLPEIEHFVEQPWAEALIRELAEIHPNLVLAHSNGFAHKRFYAEIIQPLVEQADGKIMLKLAKSKRHACGVLSSCIAYENEDWGEEVMKTSARVAAYKYPTCVAKNFDVLLGYDWTKSTVTRVTNNSPSLIFKYYESLESEPWADAMIDLAIQKLLKEGQSSTFFLYYNMYTFIEFADAHPEVVLKHSDRFKGQPNGDVILNRAKAALEGKNTNGAD